MIKTKKDLKETLLIEKKFYESNKSINTLLRHIFKDEAMIIWKYQKLLRKSEYFHNTNKKIRFFITNFKKNKYGLKYGLSIYVNCIDSGLHIWHSGNIAINPYAKIGKFCQMHGNCCVGNKGIYKNYDAPSIGDNCDIGFGAILIGDINIGNNVKIGAGAVVTKSFEENQILAGNPAKNIH